MYMTRFCVLGFTEFVILLSSTWAQDSSESFESSEDAKFTYPTTVSRRTPTTPVPSDTPEEDEYMGHFGSKYFVNSALNIIGPPYFLSISPHYIATSDNYSRGWSFGIILDDVYVLTNGWKTMRAWYHEIGEPKMKRTCELAHEKIGYGTNVTVYEAMLNIKERLFTNKNYTRRYIDVVTYRIEEGTSIWERRRYWYFTEGVRKDCIFYLMPDEPKTRQFKLHKQVCNVKVF